MITTMENNSTITTPTVDVTAATAMAHRNTSGAYIGKRVTKSFNYHQKVGHRKRDKRIIKTNLRHLELPNWGANQNHNQRVAQRKTYTDACHQELGRERADQATTSNLKVGLPREKERKTINKKMNLETKIIWRQV